MKLDDFLSDEVPPPKTAYEKVKEWRKKNPGARAEEARKWRLKHSDTYKEIRSRFREKHIDRLREEDKIRARIKRESDPEAQKLRNKAYIQRQRDLKEFLAGRERPTVCELCNEEGKIVFDHCHTRGNFRGWLCDRCNKTLGHVKDNPNLLRKMADYLEKHSGQVDDQRTE